MPPPRSRLPQRDKRQQMYRDRKIELAAAAEERFMYAPILMDNMGLNSSRHARVEHDEIDELGAKLGQAESAGWKVIPPQKRCIQK